MLLLTNMSRCIIPPSLCGKIRGKMSWIFNSEQVAFTETLLVDEKEPAKNELLSTFTPCVDSGINSTLLNARTKTHFSVCLLELKTQNKSD